jgi:hypothetical protein
MFGNYFGKCKRVFKIFSYCKIVRLEETMDQKKQVGSNQTQRYNVNLIYLLQVRPFDKKTAEEYRMLLYR